MTIYPKIFTAEMVFCKIDPWLPENLIGELIRHRQRRLLGLDVLRDVLFGSVRK
jgi:hypothetical protein